MKDRDKEKARMGERRRCEICYEHRVLIPLFCGHEEFCARCIRDWGKRSATCPMCRSNLVTEIAPRTIVGFNHATPALLAIVSRSSLYRLYLYPARWCPCFPGLPPRPRSVQPYLIQEAAPIPTPKELRDIPGYLLRICDNELSQIVITNAARPEHSRPPPLYVVGCGDDAGAAAPAKAPVQQIYVLPTPGAT